MDVEKVVLGNGVLEDGKVRGRGREVVLRERVKEEDGLAVGSRRERIFMVMTEREGGRVWEWW